MRKGKLGPMRWERAWRSDRPDRPDRPNRTTFEPVASDPATNTTRYDMKDVVAYVLTLCAVALVGSLAAELAVERALGVQFVVGWFALDLCWSPESTFVRFRNLLDYASFALPVALSVAAWCATATRGCRISASFGRSGAPSRTSARCCSPFAAG